jgi:hypothetical protein
MRAVPGQVLLPVRVGDAFFERRLSLMILFIILLEYVMALIVILFRFSATKAMISYCDSVTLTAGQTDRQSKYILSLTLSYFLND